ncbi:MAG: hypothetical protein KDE25_13165 [Novosphingobium sp.]|nr:hypothetical protein [Novosphingobium sp.]
MDASQPGLSLLFAKGKRPSVNDVERLLAASEIAGAAAHVSYRPPDDNEGLLELLVSGLTFDLCGLAPAEGLALLEPAHRFGLEAGGHDGELEAITLLPGHHLSGGAAMIPVVQAMLGLAGHIALPLAVEAVCWHPARTWMEPQYFSRVALGWLSGGPFPALGLTALEHTSGGVSSEGLAFFAGQELSVLRREGESPADTAKLAVRFIDYIVANGPFRREIEFEGPDGENLRVTTSDFGKLAVVGRGG